MRSASRVALRVALRVLLLLAAALGASLPGTARAARSTLDELVAVLDVELGAGVDAAFAAVLTNGVITELVRAGRMQVIDRSHRDQILLEQNFQCSDMANQECRVEMGQLLGVGRIVTGRLNRLASTFVLDLQLLDVASGRNLAAHQELCKCEPDDVLLLPSKVVPLLLAQLDPGYRPPPVAALPPAAMPAPAPAPPPPAPAPAPIPQATVAVAQPVYTPPPTAEAPLAEAPDALGKIAVYGAVGIPELLDLGFEYFMSDSVGLRFHPGLTVLLVSAALASEPALAPGVGLYYYAGGNDRGWSMPLGLRIDAILLEAEDAFDHSKNGLLLSSQIGAHWQGREMLFSIELGPAVFVTPYNGESFPFGASSIRVGRRFSIPARRRPRLTTRRRAAAPPPRPPSRAATTRRAPGRGG